VVTFASLMAFIAVMIELRICGCIVPCSSSASSALTTSTGFPAKASRFAISIEVPRGRSGLVAVGDVLVLTPVKMSVFMLFARRSVVVVERMPKAGPSIFVPGTS
jgi:hypothetical protein